MLLEHGFDLIIVKKKCYIPIQTTLQTKLPTLSHVKVSVKESFRSQTAV